MSWPSIYLDRVPLVTAATVVFVRITGVQTVDSHSPEMTRRLNTVARALANVARIYAGEPLDTAKELSPMELLVGEFDGGARVFRTRDGREFYPLAIERREMLDAISVLQAAKVRFK